MTLLLVDAANVVGSRPDGWWRDRPGAAARLLGRLRELPGRVVPGPDGRPLRCSGVLVVLEGAARDVAAPAGVDVVRAAGSGDDALAAVAAERAAAGDRLLAVTADRALRRRLPPGAHVTGPGWLLATLDRLAGGERRHDSRPPG